MQTDKYCIKINLKGYDHRLTDKSAEEIVNAASRAGGTVRGPVNLPTKIRKYTVNRSPHIDKKSREQFEVRIHKRLIEILTGDNQVVDSLMKLSLPPGINVDISLKGEKT